MTDPVEFGPWWLGPVSEFNGTWHSDRFRELAVELLSSFKDPDGNALGDPALLAQKESGVDGELPDSNERIAVQRAIDFAVLERNPDWSPEAGNQGLWTSSSDNSEVFLWPLDLEDGHISLTRGAMIRVQTGGYRISDDLVGHGSQSSLGAPITARRPRKTGSGTLRFAVRTDYGRTPGVGMMSASASTRMIVSLMSKGTNPDRSTA